MLVTVVGGSAKEGIFQWFIRYNFGGISQGHLDEVPACNEFLQLLGLLFSFGDYPDPGIFFCGKMLEALTVLG
jgi:hypothetical protein